MPPSLHDKVLAVRDDLNACLLERQTTVDNALLALLSGENFLLLGPPGTGKSLLVRALQRRIAGATHFEKLMSQFTTPEELFGPVDLVRYADHGEYVRIAKGALSQAHIAFLDEAYKANSAILNSLLTIANERLLHEVGFDPQRVPLLSLFGASNETPQDESLDALDDRFLLREIVGYVQEDAAFHALLTGRTRALDDVQAFITLQDLDAAKQDVRQVVGTAEVIDAVTALRQALGREGVVVSDRRWRQCGTLLKAKSWLDGQSSMDLEVIACLAHALWRHPKERKTVERLVYKTACPLFLRAIEVEDAAVELFAKLPRDDADDFSYAAENILQQMTDMYNQLHGDIEQSRARTIGRAHAALDKVAVLHKQLRVKVFKEVSRFALAV